MDGRTDRSTDRRTYRRTDGSYFPNAGPYCAYDDKTYFLVVVFCLKKESRPTDLCVRCEDVRLHPDDGWEHVIAYDDVTCCVKPEHTGTLVAYVSIL